MAELADSAPQHVVVSLLPSGSEIVSAIGASHLLAGRSHECDWPRNITHLPMLTAANDGHFTTSREVHDSTTASMQSGRGLYSIDSELLASIKPTVVVTQSLCSVCSVDLVTVERILARAKLEHSPKVVNLNPESIEDVLQGMEDVGAALGMEAESQAAVRKLQDRVTAARAAAASMAPAKYGKVAFLEWMDPLFCGGHWTPQLIEMAGGTHPLNPPTHEAGSDTPGKAEPSGIISPEAVTAMDPDTIVICPCGLDMKVAEEETTNALANQGWWGNLRAVKQNRVIIADGNAHFNRPGPRLVDALEFLVGLLNDRMDLIPSDFPWKWYTTPPDDSLQSNTSTSGTTTEATASDAQQDSNDSANTSNSSKRLSCAVGLTPDIEDAHAAATGKTSHYIDPVSGYQVFTEGAALERGFCCGRRCRHCPYGHMRVNTQRLTRINVITQTTFLPSCGHPAHLDKHAPEVLLLPLYAGDTVETATARMNSSGLRKDDENGAAGEGSHQVSLQDTSSSNGCGGCVGLAGKQHVVAVVAVDPRSRSCWGLADTAPSKTARGHNGLDEVMECCSSLTMPLVAVPVFNKDMLVMQDVMKQAEQAVRDKVQCNLEKSQQRDADQNTAAEVGAPAANLMIAPLVAAVDRAVVLPWLTNGD